ncbi:hypothetical protein CBOM_07708 [Ceraceosorus bombacis]|uniref:Uncharacterized protein n=1 Tax=Ceraceosorus bombacis TaxID=401625 RepID=A0A0P1BI74_9BASI|nr:hypothetical protein CBOM_07708 [Ceraceosorus bombacis]
MRSRRLGSAEVQQSHRLPLQCCQSFDAGHAESLMDALSPLGSAASSILAVLCPAELSIPPNAQHR